jgi:hypothetical protein
MILQRTTFQLQADVHQKAGKLARQEGRSLSSMLRCLIVEALVNRGEMTRKEAEDASR